MNTLTSVSRRKLIKEFLKRLRSSSASTSVNSEIVIPNRIERGPTDILKVLEKTLSRDLTAAHYKYHDDPYLMPKSKQEQRVFALSKESGKKAAMWIHKEHADLFQHKVADPIIPAFLPPVIYTEKSQASEELLVNTIFKAEVSEALNIYKLLDENVSIETKQSLLELLCFSNCSDLPQEELIEERWFQRGSERTKNTWSNSPDINKLFNYLISQDSKTAAAAYCAMICGTAKYLNVDKTWTLFWKCIDDNIPLNVEAYNAVIGILNLLTKGTNKPKETLLKVFNIMAQNGVQPNTQTLNKAAMILYSIVNDSMLMNLAGFIIAEFKELGIKPSLAFYYHFFGTLSERTSITADHIKPYLKEIVEVLERETLTLQDSKDVYFFPSAMYMAERSFAIDAGKKLHQLLLRDDNYQFLSDSYKESIYYRNYLTLCLNTCDIKDVLKMYYQMVPNVYIPEPSIMKHILDNLQHHSKEIINENLPKLLNQIKSFEMFDRDNILHSALTLATTCHLAPDSSLHKEFAEFALHLWKYKQNAIGRRLQRYPWKAAIYGDIAILLCRAGMYDKIFDIINFTLTQHIHVQGRLEVTQLNELFNVSISQGYTPLALLLIEYAINYGFDENVITMSKQLNNSLCLTEGEKNRLEKLVGPNMLESIKEPETSNIK